MASRQYGRGECIMAVTITWNGDYTGLQYISFDDFFGKLYRVSDRYFTLEELEGCKILYYQSVGQATNDWSQDVSFDSITEEGITQNYIIHSTRLPAVLSLSKGVEGFESGTYFYSTNGDVGTNNYVCKLVLPNAEEITKPLAEITYNGETIAQLNAGETCTLKCAGLPMETDIIVKVNG